MAPLYVVLFLVGVARAFEGPAAQALVPGLCPPRAPDERGHLELDRLAGLDRRRPRARRPRLWPGRRDLGLTGHAPRSFSSRRSSRSSSAPPPVAAGGDQVAWSGVRAGLRFVRTHGIILEALSLNLFAVLLGAAPRMRDMIRAAADRAAVPGVDQVEDDADCLCRWWDAAPKGAARLGTARQQSTRRPPCRSNEAE